MIFFLQHYYRGVANAAFCIEDEDPENQEGLYARNFGEGSPGTQLEAESDRARIRARDWPSGENRSSSRLSGSGHIPGLSTEPIQQGVY